VRRKECPGCPQVWLSAERNESNPQMSCSALALSDYLLSILFLGTTGIRPAGAADWHWLLSLTEQAPWTPDGLQPVKPTPRGHRRRNAPLPCRKMDAPTFLGYCSFRLSSSLSPLCPLFLFIHGEIWDFPLFCSLVCPQSPSLFSSYPFPYRVIFNVGLFLCIFGLVNNFP